MRAALLRSTASAVSRRPSAAGRLPRMGAVTRPGRPLEHQSSRRRKSTPSPARRLALVTGATGFIGGHLVEGLLARGSRVRALVRNEAKAAATLPSGADIVLGDVRDPDSLPAAMAGAQLVFHTAAPVRTCGTSRSFSPTPLPP